jgi:glycosyltransferase involved in cell wall biosynthesis
MIVPVLAEEPTQASVRTLLDEMLGEVGPVVAGRVPVGGRDSIVNGRSPIARRGLTSPPSVAYLLPGLPPEGSGGSHSLVQEARGLRELGARSRVCVPEDSLETAGAVYGNEDGLFVAYAEEASSIGAAHSAVLDAVADAEVVIATEYPSVDLLARFARERPRTVCAYYVQDYEPLFAAPASSRADRALLSYRAIPDLLLFAKTDWLCGLVRTLHGVPVAKVAPSLDRQLFHPGGRPQSSGPLHVVAMIRPRTPRRRPAATLQALAAIARELGEGVNISTFGCDEDSFLQVAGEALGSETPPSSHLGLLSRLEVSQLMRRCDVFIDASAYQAFGRTGLEAMACGAVPLLPDLGGVHEYAHAENAVILDRDSPGEIAEAAVALARERARLRRLRDAGLRDAQRFSVQRAARSQLELFAEAVAASGDLRSISTGASASGVLAL